MHSIQNDRNQKDTKRKHTRRQDLKSTDIQCPERPERHPRPPERYEYRNKNIRTFIDAYETKGLQKEGRAIEDLLHIYHFTRLLVKRRATKNYMPRHSTPSPSVPPSLPPSHSRSRSDWHSSDSLSKRQALARSDMT